MNVSTELDLTGQQIDTPIISPNRQAADSPGPQHAAVQVQRVSSRRLLNTFVRFPWQIYANDPAWVPPLIHEVKEFLNPKRHPFYLHGEATPFVAFCNGLPVGRILVSHNPARVRETGVNSGYFGMFESIDDPHVASSLLATAANWLRERGCTSMLGPIDYSNNYTCGLLVDGFEMPPRYLMNHHPRYYADLMAACGMQKSQDLYAWWFVDANDILAKWGRIAARLSQRESVTIRTISRSHFDEDVQSCLEVYNGTQSDSWEFTRLTRAEFDYMVRRLNQIGVADHAYLAEVDGKPVGFALTLPDINEVIQPLNGRLTRFGLPINAARFTYRLRRAKTARMMVLCLLEGYRHRGIGELLVFHTLRKGKLEYGFTQAELGWTVDGNTAIDRFLERVGAVRYKTYRVYERPLGRSLSSQASVSS